MAIKVSIAIVESIGHVLVGTRAVSGALAGKTEFPGGKCLADETPRSCAVRECREETGLIVVPREHLVTTIHEYDHETVELNFWRCALTPDLPDCAVPQKPFRWVSLQNLNELNFPDGNDDVLSIIAGTTVG
ncbi:MAG: NUDIX domain-containing protein [Fuerstiella sp.]|nr:NUDIX domain-containing protein [Fuerstiella sp.]MCP4786936.1 NUDIX domain-containing protein [Fuerstiella sp.]MCP4859256.1 NUDIX domain-containing protein [Fuerstiella sp.]